MSGTISMPTHVRDERVVAVFPCIGGETFVEANVVTTDDAKVPSFTVRLIRPDGGTIFSAASTTSFPEAIRQARKNAGWG